MYVTYFDEVKADRPAGRDHYLVAGLVIPMENVGEIEASISALSKELFGSTELIPDTEFHAEFIYRGKGNCKGRSIAERVDILVKLARIIGENVYISKVYASVDSSKIFNEAQAPEFAFAYFVERVQMCVVDRPCIMIGDLDDEQARNMVRDFSKFRAEGTPWAHGIEIKSVVDSVHFCRSHHSRLIQLADAYAWLTTHKRGQRTGDMAKMVSDGIANVNLFPNRYKIWPS